MILASVLFACSKKEPQETDPAHRAILSSLEPFPQDSGTLEADHWYSVNLQGQPAGHMHIKVTLHDTPRGKRRIIDTRDKMTLRRGGQEVQMSSRERLLEDHNGHLLRVSYTESEAGGEQVVVHAGKVGNEMVTLRGPEIRRMPFEPDALGSQRPYAWVLKGEDLKPGEEFSFRTYIRHSAGYSDNRLLVQKVSSYIEAELTTADLPGIVQRVRLDLKFELMAAESTMGAVRISLRKEDSRAAALRTHAAADLGPLMQIRTDVRFSDRDAVTRALYRIDGLPDFVDESWLTGPGQKVTGHPMKGTFLIEATRMSASEPAPFPAKLDDPQHANWLRPTALAQANDPEIVATARRVASGAPDAWTAAKRLRRWVTDEVEVSMGMGFASAAEVYRRREGDCSEQAVLLATLARAVKIPARCVMGLVYHDGTFARHMWTEVHTSEWRPLDPAMGTDTISAAWIRLGVYSLRLTDDRKTGMGGMLAFASDLKITVLDYESSLSSTTR